MMLKDTEFHRTMRAKMKKHYHENQGREKKIVRYYLKKHGLSRDFLQGCTTIQDEIRMLKHYNLQQKIQLL